MKKNPNPFQLFLAFTVCLYFTSCTDDLELVTPDKQNVDVLTSEVHSADAASGTTITEISFTATAMIEYCHGENIEFSGIIENRVNTTVDETGATHFIRQFTVKGLTGKGKIGTTYTGTTYTVQGGAEMFSIHDDGNNLSLGGSEIFIHQGTLVFINDETGEKVVARHVIRKAPGQGVMESAWYCQC